MNCQQFDQQLPDFLGGELSAQHSVDCAEHIATCAACRTRVGGLQDVQALLQSATAGAERFPANAVTVRSQSSPASRAANVRPLIAILRYAAVIAIAFLAGFATRGPGPRSQSATIVKGSGPETPAINVVDPVANPRLQREYREITSAHPEASSFGRTLLLLAKR